MSVFGKIFEPIQLRKMRLKNRLVGSPVTTNFASPTGEPTERLIHFYRERAKGGAGLIIVEGSFIDPEGKGYVNQLGIHEDKLIPLLRKLADAIHEGGAKASIQIHHVGRRTSSKITGSVPKAPSPIPCYPGGEVPEELTLDGIRRIVEAHVMAALRAKRAGFDSVDIHAAHGYLIPAFFSPLSNKRKDDYGGSLENRAKIAVEIIRDIRTVVGDEFPVTMKISGDEYAKGGVSLEETKRIVLLLEKAGIDAIAVSAGTVIAEESGLDVEHPHKFVRTLPMGTKEGCFSYLARAIKETVAIPVMAVGRINTPFVAEEILNTKQADLICLGRGLLADPYFPQKALEGKHKEIRVCIACNQGCFDRLFLQKDITCMINPVIAYEKEVTLKKAVPPRTVWVIGGGPAGMEAARVARLRGNRVTLFDDHKEMGGQLQLAGIPPDRQEFHRIVRYQRDRLEKEGVTFRLNTVVQREDILRERPDTIIIATGARPMDVRIEGVSGKNVKEAWDILNGEEVTEKRVIVIGGGLVGCETAEFLADKGKNVVLLEMLPEIAPQALGDNRKFLLAKLNRLQVELRTNTAAKKITAEGIFCSVSGREEFVSGEAIILALGAGPNRALSQSLNIQKDGLEVRGRSIRILEAGDCVEVRTAVEAFFEGFKAGLEA